MTPVCGEEDGSPSYTSGVGLDDIGVLAEPGTIQAIIQLKVT